MLSGVWLTSIGAQIRQAAQTGHEKCLGDSCRSLIDSLQCSQQDDVFPGFPRTLPRWLEGRRRGGQAREAQRYSSRCLMATASISISPPHLPASFLINPKHHTTSYPLAFLPSSFPSKTRLSYPIPSCGLTLKASKRWRISAFRDGLLLLETSTVESSQELVSRSDDAASTVIFALLFVAFAGLSILTVGIIYIGVTDFLQKREREQFEKEEAEKKKGSKKRITGRRARAGPRGFGQKVEDDDDDLD